VSTSTRLVFSTEGADRGPIVRRERAQVDDFDACLRIVFFDLGRSLKATSAPALRKLTIVRSCPVFTTRPSRRGSGSHCPDVATDCRARGKVSCAQERATGSSQRMAVRSRPQASEAFEASPPQPGDMGERHFTAWL